MMFTSLSIWCGLKLVTMVLCGNISWNYCSIIIKPFAPAMCTIVSTRPCGSFLCPWLSSRSCAQKLLQVNLHQTENLQSTVPSCEQLSKWQRSSNSETLLFEFESSSEAIQVQNSLFAFFSEPETLIFNILEAKTNHRKQEQNYACNSNFWVIRSAREART